MSEKVNIEEFVGRRYGNLTVIGKYISDNPRSNSFLLRCDCGEVIKAAPSKVFDGFKRSCGKCKYRFSSRYDLSKYEKFIGEKKNKLTVIGVEYLSEDHKRASFVCMCDCWNVKKVLPHDFKRGGTKSCGVCRTNAKIVDGRSSKYPDIYRVWLGILYRCENEKSREFHCYGGRGIKVCEEWKDYLNFERWVLENGGIRDGYSIDRIDNDGDYSPNNCRFATAKEQARNRSKNVIIEYDGKKMCLKDWATQLNIYYPTLVKRYNRGWSIERMLTTPVNKYVKANWLTFYNVLLSCW